MRHHPLLIALLALGLSAPAMAESDGGNDLDGWSRWTFQVGAIDLDADPRVGIQVGETRPPLVDFKRIGINDRDLSYWARGVWRFGEKWSLSFNAYSYDKTSTMALEEEIEFGDEVFPISANIESSLSTDIYAIDVSRSFWRSETYDIGFGAGVHFLDLDIGIAAEGAAGGSFAARAERAAFLAPLPNVVIYGEFKPGERWLWRNRAGWFGLSIDNFDGRVLTFMSSLEYRFTERFGIGAGYSGVNLELDVDEGNVTELYRIDYDGPYVFMSFQF